VTNQPFLLELADSLELSPAIDLGVDAMQLPEIDALESEAP
jgi:hypothetical protein